MVGRYEDSEHAKDQGSTELVRQRIFDARLLAVSPTVGWDLELTFKGQRTHATDFIYLYQNTFWIEELIGRGEGRNAQKARDFVSGRAEVG